VKPKRKEKSVVERLELMAPEGVELNPSTVCDNI